MVKPIKIWTSSAGPNGWKPMLVLEELGLPYEIKVLAWHELGTPEHRKANPCGKVPVMEDPNTDITLWESGAISLYLVDQYDKDNKLTYTSIKEKSQVNQWLMYQMSQQGPYYGQMSWFKSLHPEKLPSAIERYVRQVDLVLGVLNDALEGKEWLVGDKCTYADLSFIMWNVLLPLALQLPETETPLKKYPNVMAWHERMLARPGPKKVLAARLKAMSEDGLGENGLPADTSVEDVVKELEQRGNKANRST